jgi:prepilin-type N-terminal cleavage/methylation domain-containing protein
MRPFHYDLTMKIRRHTRGFTLMELLVVVAIIALLAALMLGLGSSGSSKRQTTQSARATIEAALERYRSEHGEFPEPVNPDEMAEIMPGKVYRIGAARCLYQALRGDGSDAIKGASSAEAQSNGTIDSTEIKNAITPELPQSLWRKVGSSYILVDAFGHPFQYTKADGEKKNTINSSFDLWSFGEDEKNIMSKSKDAEANASLGAKWIKNW